MGDAELRETAHAIAARGSLIFHLRLAEAVAGSAGVAENAEGWAVDLGSDGYEVAGLGAGRAPRVLRRITFDADGSPVVERGRGRASARQVALASARRTALAVAGTFYPRAGAIVTPPRLDSSWNYLDAYVLRLSASRDDFVAGPHWRVRLSASGEEALATEVECSADFVVAPSGYVGGRLAIRHEGAVPSPLHVTLSLEHGAAFEVFTEASGQRWRIDGERVNAI